MEDSIKKTIERFNEAKAKAHENQLITTEELLGFQERIENLSEEELEEKILQLVHSLARKVYLAKIKKESEELKVHMESVEGGDPEALNKYIQLRLIAANLKASEFSLNDFLDYGI